MTLSVCLPFKTAARKSFQEGARSVEQEVGLLKTQEGEAFFIQRMNDKLTHLLQKAADQHKQDKTPVMMPPAVHGIFDVFSVNFWADLLKGKHTERYTVKQSSKTM